MIRVDSLLPSPVETNLEITLDYDARRKRRQTVSLGKETILIDLPEAPHIRNGDGLKLEDGRIIRVRAEPEALVEIETDDPVRIAWHLGNRHLPTQILGDVMRIRRDHVIEHMLQGLDCRLTILQAPFDPEGGAYGHAH